MLRGSIRVCRGSELAAGGIILKFIFIFMTADFTKISLKLTLKRNYGAFKAVSHCGGPNCGRDHRRWPSPSQLRLGRLPQSRRGMYPCRLHVAFLALK